MKKLKWIFDKSENDMHKFNKGESSMVIGALNIYVCRNKITVPGYNRWTNGELIEHPAHEIYSEIIVREKTSLLDNVKKMLHEKENI